MGLYHRSLILIQNLFKLPTVFSTYVFIHKNEVVVETAQEDGAVENKDHGLASRPCHVTIRKTDAS